MITGITVPIEVAVVLCALFGVLGAWAGCTRALRQHGPRANPLADVMQSAVLGAVIDLATRREAARRASLAVLHARIDQLDPLHDIASRGDREQLHDHVAAVMRAGLRRDDRLSHIEGEGFTIIIPGADERSAMRIVDRLRSLLGQIRFPRANGSAGVTASFGVAAGRHGARGDQLVRRARRALDATLAQGQDHVVTTSEFEEVLYLPAPEARSAAA